MSPMHQTKTGRWQPDSPAKPEPSIPLFEQYGVDLRLQMPWWYPIMHFEAAVGRLALSEDEQS